MKVNCKNCNKEFNANPAKIKAGKGIFCSVDCVAKYKDYSVNHPLVCFTCEKTFYRCKSHFLDENKVFCGKPCFYKWRTGENHFHFKDKVEKKCEICGKNFYVKPYKSKQRTCSIKCRQQLVAGKFNWNWKGGISILIRGLRFSPEYRFWRKQVFERDKFICQICGTKNGEGKNVYLEAHHIELFSKNKDLIFDVNNGMTLCYGCHKTIHSGPQNYLLKKGNNLKVEY